MNTDQRTARNEDPSRHPGSLFRERVERADPNREWFAGEPAAAALHDLIDGIDAVVWEAEPDGTVRFINRLATELFGYPQKRWLCRPGFWDEITHPDDRALAREQFDRCAAQGREGELEYPILAADGRVVWMRRAIRVFRDGMGGVERLRIVATRIGRRRRIERQLYAARQQSADELADMTYLHDLSRRLWDTPELEPLLEEVLTATLAIQGTDMGLVRLYDPQRDELEIAASVGLPAPFLAQYRRVPAREVTCRVSTEERVPLIVEDVETNPSAAPDRAAACCGGYRARYTTLLINRSGTLLGTIDGCFRDPHRPPLRQVHLVELFARQATDFLENARQNRALREANQSKDVALATLAHQLPNPLNAILHAAHILGYDDSDASTRAKVGDLIAHQTAVKRPDQA